MCLDCTIFVCSSDGYSDLWEAFFKLFKLYWPDCPYKIVLNTESKKYIYEGLNIECFQLFKNHNVSYGERMIAYLKRVDTPFVFVLMDDFFIRNIVNKKEIEKVIGWMKSDIKAAMFSFQAFPDELNRKSKVYKGFSKRPKYGEYKFNFQAAIWRKDLLVKFWKKHETPWEWETIGNFRSFTDKYDFYVINTDMKTPINYGFKNSGMGVFRGKWGFDSVKELFELHDIEIDYSIRGIYMPSDKNIVRMKKESWIFDEVRRFRSYGSIRYLLILFWRMKQKIRKVFMLRYSNDYIQYQRSKKR